MFEEEDRITTIDSQIRVLQSALSAATSDVGDWKIIKIYEARLLGKEDPYNLEELIEKRQSIRDQINMLQEQL